jgi:cation diffusion facilitator family transporter
MTREKLQKSRGRIKSVTNLSIIVNSLLSVTKFVIGFFAGSIALVADGVHSLSDMVTDIAVLVGSYFGAKEPDAEHPYGHGRIETFSALFVAAVLGLAGCLMIYKASMKIAQVHTHNVVQHISNSVLAVAVLSVLSKELLYRITQSVAVKTHSSALYANAWHHRSDALSSIAVIIGFVSMRFGYVDGDLVAAIAVGLMIVMVSVKIIGGCLSEFTEKAVDSETMEQIKRIIDAEQQIRQYHNLRTRTVGREIFLDLHILVAPELNISQAHKISENLEKAMHEQIPQPVNITVHIEPDIPNQRK